MPAWLTGPFPVPDGMMVLPAGAQMFLIFGILALKALQHWLPVLEHSLSHMQQGSIYCESG